MTLKPWDEIAPEPLAFPIGGRTFTVQPMTYKDGLRLEHLLDDPKAREGLTNRDLWQLGLGDTFDQMVDAGVTTDAIARAGLAAITDYQHGRAAAEVIWESGLHPQALADQAAAERPTRTHAKRTRRGTGGGRAPHPA